MARSYILCLSKKWKFWNVSEKITMVFKDTERKSWWKYEIKQKEDRRIKAIPAKDIKEQRRKNLVDRWRNRLVNSFVVNKERIYRTMKYKYEISIGLFLVSIWLSGWYAHAGLKFESLLSVVIGVLILGLFSTLGGNKNARNK